MVDFALALTLVPIFVASISVTLSYLSHRQSILDTPYERREKIISRIVNDEITLTNFTEFKYKLNGSFSKAEVIENDGSWYKIKKYLNPFGDIEGTTIIHYKIPNLHLFFPEGEYVLEGLEDDSDVLIGALNVDHEGGILAIEVDTVDPLIVHTAAYQGIADTDAGFTDNTERSREILNRLFQIGDRKIGLPKNWEVSTYDWGDRLQMDKANAKKFEDRE